MKQEMFNYLKSFMVGSDWNNGNTAKQARAMFTTICFVGNIDADTSECDNMLHELYNESGMENFVEYDDFESYMVELIV
jgi:hypothetical protein